MQTVASQFQYNMLVISDNSQILLGTQQIVDPIETPLPQQHILTGNNCDILHLDPQVPLDSPQGGPQRSARIDGHLVKTYE